MPTGAREGEEYFTPDITDIRVGYECECLWCCAEPRQWIPIKITSEDNMNTTELPIEEAIYRVKDNEIRVPYLTKEQIEAEGWKQCLGLNRLCKNNSTITILQDNRIIIGKNESVVYCGECKDINTFRYITKLLGI